jgi:RNA polymerase sigma factor (sigma-70 family)
MSAISSSTTSGRARLGARNEDADPTDSPRRHSADSSAGSDRRRRGAAAPRRRPEDTEPRTKPGVRGQRLGGDELARLVEAAAAGQQDAWDTLLREFGGMIWAVARAHRLYDADAADVAQATWLRLLEHVGDLHTPACVGAWLAMTARRECLRVLRVAQRLVLLGEDADEQESRDMPPDEALLVAERDRALWRSFSCLRPSDQALLRLLMADPRPSYEEISAALDMPIGSIGPTRARALERLRQELDSEVTLTLLVA